MATDNDLIAVWRKAANDLGFELHSAINVGLERFPVHVPMFGRPAGALPVWIGDERSRREAAAKGYYCSLLNPKVYGKYDRARFIEMLLDWGWCGQPDEAPKWYKDELAKVTG